SRLARQTGVAIWLKSIAAHILLKWSMAGNLGNKGCRFKKGNDLAFVQRRREKLPLTLTLSP
ncbi:hypothetical protein ACCT09_57045, partial [Rhizobium ruizarguesonis]